MPEPHYIQVILPLKLAWEPWYATDSDIAPGRRVRVEFAHKEYLGVVHRTSLQPELSEDRIQSIIGEAHGFEDILPEELRFWEFVSEYYLCSIGEVYKAAYPSMKLDSESAGIRQNDLREKRLQNERERILNGIRRLEERLQRKSSELDARRESPRAKASLTERMESAVRELSCELDRARLVLESFDKSHMPVTPLSKPVSRQPYTGKPELIVGTDRAGTYEEAIRLCLAAGRDALVLAPDFIFLDRLEKALRPSFPDLMTVDSRRSASQRRKIADSLRNPAGPSVILGTRISLFLPFTNLGLVIVDEEQDSSYKQSDPAPRYNGRDCAVMLARIHGCRILLGSALPSLESIFNSLSGKYIRTDIGHFSPANVEIIDIQPEFRKNGMVGAFSRKLIEAVANTDGPVVIIRGWEKKEDTDTAVAALFPSKDIRVMRYKEARESDLSVSTVAFLQADALLGKDDFRADEKALQIVANLSCRCLKLIVQTAHPSGFDGSRDAATLLQERKTFGFPPYTRLIEIRRHGSDVPSRMHFLPLDKTLSDNKAAILRDTDPRLIIDVDPV